MSGIMQRTIVVGDVHGCLDELEAVLAGAGWQAGDRVVLVGDIVAKGPDSAGVVALARERGALAVMGNHDRRVLRLRAIERSGRPADDHPVKPEHQQVVDTLTPADWEYLEALPLFVRLGRERAGGPETAVIHGGALPGVPLEQQDPEDLMCMRSVRDDGRATKKLAGTPWASLWRGPERLVFGHDAVRGLQQHEWATGLDTGCVYGGQLTALVLPERRLVSVPAKRAYVAW
jgi:hypothetical protein